MSQRKQTNSEPTVGGSIPAENMREEPVAVVLAIGVYVALVSVGVPLGEAIKLAVEFVVQVRQVVRRRHRPRVLLVPERGLLALGRTLTRFTA